jgi:phosphomannomutase
MLAAAVSSTLQAHGFDVLDAGICATPTVGVLVREEQAVGAIQISASHNPPQYNGIKLFNREGRVIPAAEGERVRDAYRQGVVGWRDVNGLGSSSKIVDPHAAHEQLVLKTIDPGVIAARRFRVLLDSNRGAGSLLGSRLLESLGIHALFLGHTPDGKFEHPPEPLAENLQTTAAAVRQSGFDIGFCQDPDADRLAIIDEQGHYIGEEYTVALCLLEVLSRAKGPIVTNCATSSMSKVIAADHGVPYLKSAVGEANVVDLMKESGALFGGEGNGGPIDPRVGWVRDSFVGMALVLSLMARTGLKVSQLVKRIPFFAMVKQKISFPVEQLPQAYLRLQEILQPLESSLQDGLRMDWSDRWLLVRGSNTEPIVRLIAEAPTQEAATELCTKAEQILLGRS